MKSRILSAAVMALALTSLGGMAGAKEPMHQPRHERSFFGFEDGPFGRHCMRFGHARHCNDFGMTGNRITCGEARYRVAARGFSKVVTRNCAGSSYRFSASKKGARYSITVSARTGYLSAHRL